MTVPEGAVSTGWPTIRRRLEEMRVEFDPWQQDLARIALSKRANGIYACTVDGITISIPRQVGKTFFVGSLIIAMCLEFPGLQVLWTAHHGKTSDMTFESMQGMVKRPTVKCHLKPNSRNDGIRTANGQQEIAFANGSKIMFGSRDAGFGRGFHEIDIEVFDEAQILKDKALEDMVAATNQTRHPHGALLFFMGTPPRPTDPGEMFTQKKKRALAGQLKDGAFVECSADPGANYEDPKQWKRANPSYPLRTPHESMLRLKANLPTEDAWRREGMGVWDDFESTESLVPFDPNDWRSLAVEDVVFSGPQVALALDMTPKGELFIAAARWTADRKVHVEVGYKGPSGPGALKYLLGLITQWNPVALVIDRGSPAERLLPDLLAAGVEPELTSTGLMAQAAGGLEDAVKASTVSHVGDQLVQDSVDQAEKRTLSGGGWVFSRRAPIVAIALAHWGLVKFGSFEVKAKPLPRKVSASAGRSVSEFDDFYSML